jgi:hypothetical protein
LFHKCGGKDNDFVVASGSFWKLLLFLQAKQKHKMMTAVQINAELFRTMSEIADDEGLMMKLLKYAKKLAATKEDETLVSKEEFMASLDRGEEEYRQGKCHTMLPNESLDEFLKRIG